MANVFDGGDVGGKASGGGIENFKPDGDSGENNSLNTLDIMGEQAGKSDKADQISEMDTSADTNDAAEAQADAMQEGDQGIENELEAKEMQKDPAKGAQERLKNAEDHMKTLEGTEMEDAGKNVMKEMGEIMGKDFLKLGGGEKASQALAGAVAGGELAKVAKAVGGAANKK